MVDGALGAAGTHVGRLELPRVLALVVHEVGVVVAFVEVLKHGGEDLGLLVRQGDAFGGGLHELAAAGGVEEGRDAEDVFVGGEEALFAADDERDDGRGQGAVGPERWLVNE